MKRKRNRVQRVTDSAVGWQNECAKYQRATVALLMRMGGRATITPQEFEQAERVAAGSGLGIRVEPDGGVSFKVEVPRIIVPSVGLN